MREVDLGHGEPVALLPNRAGGYSRGPGEEECYLGSSLCFGSVA